MAGRRASSTRRLRSSRVRLGQQTQRKLPRALNRCVIWPLSSKNIFGRSRVDTVMVSPELSLICVP